MGRGMNNSGVVEMPIKLLVVIIALAFIVPTVWAGLSTHDRNKTVDGIEGSLKELITAIRFVYNQGTLESKEVTLDLGASTFSSLEWIRMGDKIGEHPGANRSIISYKLSGENPEYLVITEPNIPVTSTGNRELLLEGHGKYGLIVQKNTIGFTDFVVVRKKGDDGGLKMPDLYVGSISVTPNPSEPVMELNDAAFDEYSPPMVTGIIPPGYTVSAVIKNIGTMATNDARAKWEDGIGNDDGMVRIRFMDIIVETNETRDIGIPIELENMEPGEEIEVNANDVWRVIDYRYWDDPWDRALLNRRIVAEIDYITYEKDDESNETRMTGGDEIDEINGQNNNRYYLHIEVPPVVNSIEAQYDDPDPGIGTFITGVEVFNKISANITDDNGFVYQALWWYNGDEFPSASNPGDEPTYHMNFQDAHGNLWSYNLDMGGIFGTSNLTLCAIDNSGVGSDPCTERIYMEKTPRWYRNTVDDDGVAEKGKEMGEKEETFIPGSSSDEGGDGSSDSQLNYFIIKLDLPQTLREGENADTPDGIPYIEGQSNKQSENYKLELKIPIGGEINFGREKSLNTTVMGMDVEGRAYVNATINFGFPDMEIDLSRMFELVRNGRHIVSHWKQYGPVLKDMVLDNGRTVGDEWDTIRTPASVHELKSALVTVRVAAEENGRYEGLASAMQNISDIVEEYEMTFETIKGVWETVMGCAENPASLLDLVQFEAIAGADITAAKEWDIFSALYPIFPPFITAKVDVNADFSAEAHTQAGISGTLDSVDFDYVSADFDTSFGLTLRCSVLVGVNFGIAGGGIEGWIEGRPELTLATGFDYSTPDANGNGGFEPECSGALDITLSAGLGAYAKFLWWTKSWSFWDGSYTLGHWDFDAFGGTSNGPDTPFSHEPDPSSLVNQSGDVQFPTGPSISQLGDQTVIVNSIDKNNNPANPDFQIIVDVNGASVQLTTNNKLKTDPHVLHDGTGKALVVWTESVDNQDLTGTSLNLTNFMEDSRVVYAILDGTTIEAGLAYIYTPSPPVADIQPSLVLMGNGDIMATWIHDEGGDVMTSDDQATWFSVWNGFVWSVPALKNDHASFHYDNQMAALPDDEILSVWIRDGDENLYTTDDQQLVYSVYNGTNWTLMEYLTTGNMSVESLSLSSNENYAVLAWLARDWQGAFNIKFASWDTSSETWSSIRVVNSTFYPVQLPQVAINSQGLAAVVWKSGQVMNWTNANESGIYYCTLDMTSGGGQTKPWLAAITNSPLLDFWCDMVLYDDRTLLYTFNNLTDPTDRSSKYQELAYIGLKPDFSIMNMTANGEASIIAREGDVVWINATVRNAGDVPAEDFDVRFYDGNPLLGGAFIGKVEVPSLDRMETVGISIHWAAESGCREIYGVVDAVGGIGECSENNNMASCMIDAPVDVYITYRNITLTPEEPDEWETVEIKALVKNIGFGSASDVEIEFYDGDPICGGRLLDTKTIAHIPLEGEAEVMAYWSARSGYHELFVLANISDANGENNKAFRKVWLTPDIEVSAMSVSNPMIKEGEKAIISATIKNTGSGDSDNIFVKFFTHDMFIGHHFISLDQGDESTVSVDWTPPSGNYMIYASAFPTSNINELSEAENKRSASLAVISSRDVMVELALAESDEGILNITANVTNGGFGSLSGVVLRLYGGEPGTGSMKLLDTTIPELAQGETRSIMLDWIPDIDARTIYAVVDPDDVISETNENNNVAKENLDFGSWTPDGQDDDRDSGMVEAVYTGSMFGILVAVVAIIITFIIRRRKRRE